MLSPRTWLTEGLDLMSGAIIGSLDSVVGYECDGCARKVDPDSGSVVPSGEDGTPPEFVIVAQAHSSVGGPGGQWGAEFSSAIPSMELFEHEAAEMAIESGVIKDLVTEHTGAFHLKQLLLPARPVRCCPVQLCAMHARVFHLTPALNPSTRLADPGLHGEAREWRDNCQHRLHRLGVRLEAGLSDFSDYDERAAAAEWHRHAAAGECLSTLERCLIRWSEPTLRCTWPVTRLHAQS